MLLRRLSGTIATVACTFQRPHCQKGEDERSESEHTETCQRLLQAISASKPYELRQLIKGRTSEDSLNSCRNAMGQTPLILAADQGNTMILETLREGGCSLVSVETDKHGLSPLAYAAWRGHHEVAAKLLEEGVDPCPFDIFGVAPIHKAAAFGSLDTIKLLLARGVSPNVLMGPASAPEEYHAYSLCQSPLHLAVNSTWNVSRAKREEIMIFLLEHGADASLVDINGDAPLHCAARTEQWNAIRILVSAGANVTQRNFNGESARDIVMDQMKFPYLDNFMMAAVCICML